MVLVFDLLSRMGVGGNVLVRLSFLSILVGLIAALPAIATGVLDWAEVKQEKPAWKLGLYHMLLNLIVFALFALNFGLRLRDWNHATATPNSHLLLSLAATLLLAFSAWLGGRMVYHHGIGVGRQSKEKWRSIAEAGGANLPEAANKDSK